MISKVPTYGLCRNGVLCLSGPGFRAALFHLGALTRLNELGLLAQTETIGAVAGGSILAALLAARVAWPLEGAFREWPEAIAEPMREIARRNLRARSLLRTPTSGGARNAALEERFARELVRLGNPQSAAQPRLVFGGAGLALGEMADESRGRPEQLRWELGGSAHGGYERALVSEAIAAVRTDLGAFDEAEQGVLENHGYILADAALRSSPDGEGMAEPLPPGPPHPYWMNDSRAREALATSGRRPLLGRLRPRRIGPARNGRGPTPTEAGDLLERYSPVLQYDSLESFRADSVSSIVSLAMGRRSNALHRADGTLIATALAVEGGEVPRLDLDFLGPVGYANGEPARADDYIDESGGAHAADALAMRRRQGCADVVYGRACRDDAGRLWLQYWLFYYYNDKGFLGAGMHEGDWEMVQLWIGENGVPRAATFGRHAGGVRLEWEEVERRSVGGDEAPVVYPARGSHASLPRAGTYPAPAVPDHNDGLGIPVRPRLVRIGEPQPGWVAWPGRWGSTRRREAFEGSSPRGPAQQLAWWDPAGFHRESRPWDEVDAWHGEAPRQPLLHAEREGDGAVVSYGFSPATSRAGEPRWIVAAPFAAGDDEPPRTQTFKVERAESSFALRLPLHAQHEGVRLSVASKEGVPGPTLSARFDER